MSSDLPIIPIGMRNAPFALDLWASDCPPTQFLREFTVNGIEAIDAYRREVGVDYHGQVVWTLDPLLEAAGQRKLSCIDAGIGMSPDEMPSYLNDLAASGKSQGLDRNYGMGAKVSAAVRNPHGVIYTSWRAGLGHMVEVGRDRSGIWGMRQRALPDGDVSAVVPISDEAKPDQLAGLDHGTIVTFLGEADDDDTTRPPTGERSERWIIKTLNQRFHALPDWVTIKVREERTNGEASSLFMRTVRGQRYFLD
jgi:hypothetical protein